MKTFLELLASNVLLAAVLALLVLGVTRIWRNPHLAHGLWFLVLLKLVTPPLVFAPLPISFPTAQEQVAATPVEESSTREVAVIPEEGLVLPPATSEVTIDPAFVAATSESVAEEAPKAGVVSANDPFPWREILTGVWLLGMIVALAIALQRRRRLQAVLSVVREADGETLAMAQELAERIGLSCCPRIGVVAGRIPPFVTLPGPGQMVVLPEELLDELESTQVQSVLAHELAHLRRRDHWVRGFELLVLWVFWWNPVAWMASRRLRQAAEDCCDAYVVWALPGGRRSYGSALLRTVEFLTEGPRPRLLAANTMGPPLFKHRIESIMKKNTPPRTSGPTRALVLGLGLVALPFAMTALSEGHPHPDDATKPSTPQIGKTTAEDMVAPSTSDVKSERAPVLKNVPVIGNLFREASVDATVDLIQSTAYEVFEYEAKDEQTHQLARVVRKNLQDAPNQSFQDAAKMAQKLGVSIKSVRRQISVDGHASDAVVKAAKQLKFGQVSEVIQDGESCYIVRRTVTLQSPKEAGTVRRIQKFKVRDVDADVVIESAPVAEDPNVLRARPVAPAPGVGGGRANPGQIQSEAEYKARLTLLDLDVQEAEVHFEALIELKGAFIADSAEGRENRLQTKLAKIRIERARAAIDLFKAQNPRGGKPRKF